MSSLKQRYFASRIYYGMDLRQVIARKFYLVFRNPLLFYKRHTVRTRGLVWHQGKILLVRNIKGTQRWTLPGGGRKLMENYEQAWEREIQEEVKLKVNRIKDLGLVKGPHGQRYYIFSGHAEEQEYTTRKWEILDANWFKPDNLPDYPSPVIKMALEEFNRGGKRV
ncbi:MAG: NUDIX domain-containing protein [Candidatus Saccharimonadales bacterium]